jgi:hypothetical protein
LRGRRTRILEISQTLNFGWLTLTPFIPSRQKKYRKDEKGCNKHAAKQLLSEQNKISKIPSLASRFTQVGIDFPVSL